MTYSIRRFLPLFLALCGMFVAGCLPQSEKPLSSPATSIYDSAFEGVYAQKGKRDDDPGYWHFHYRGVPVTGGQKPQRTSWIEILSVEPSKTGGLKTDRYRALATRICGNNYLSFIPVLEAGGKQREQGSYRFARYEVNWLGELRVWLADNNAFADAIKAGKIRGRVVKGKFGVDVSITDSTEHLAAFIAASDPKQLFGGKPLVMGRIAR